MNATTDPAELVHEVLGAGYFGSIDGGDMPAAVHHVADDVEMVFDPEDDLRGRSAVLSQLQSSPPKPGRFHRLGDVLAGERDGFVVACGSLLTSGGTYRFSVGIDRSTRLVTHFVTQMLPRPD